MPPKPEPSSPREAYKAVIDEFVADVTDSQRDHRLVDSGEYSPAAGHESANAFVRSLTKEQREVLAAILRDQRISAVASALSTLTWWVTCRNLAITFRDDPVPFGLTEEGFHGDFVARCEGWEWLDGPSAGADEPSPL
jgi:hypothetical protein